MSATDAARRAKPRKPRSDGWTPERQLRFLDALAGSRNVAEAAGCAGMSRESAYRLRNRPGGALFGLLWDRVLAPELPVGEVHIPPLTTGRIMRLLGPYYRRKTGDSSMIDGKAPRTRDT
jgi:hypothetical protein